jgi:hypothetical protein
MSKTSGLYTRLNAKRGQFRNVITKNVIKEKGIGKESAHLLQIERNKRLLQNNSLLNKNNKMKNKKYHNVETKKVQKCRNKSTTM